MNSPSQAIRWILVFSFFLSLNAYSRDGAERFAPNPTQGVNTDEPVDPQKLMEIEMKNHQERFKEIQGQLRCVMSPTNQGEPCILKIKDQKSGKSFVLQTPKTDLRELYYRGTRDITAVGEFMDQETFMARKIKIPKKTQ